MHPDHKDLFVPIGPKLLGIPTTGMSRHEWLGIRKGYLGGSDTGTILGLNHRFSKLELFYQKLGRIAEGDDGHTPPTYWGTKLEDDIMYTGQFYDFATGSYIDNEREGIKLREIADFRYMIMNPDYPWMLANIDGAVNLLAQQGIGSAGLEFVSMDAIAESKTISRQAMQMWKLFPPYYLTQGLLYITVCSPVLTREELQLYFLQDKDQFYGFRIGIQTEELDLRNLRDMMMEETFEFHQTLVKGRDIIDNGTSEAQITKGLEEIEPKPDHTLSYNDFLSELYVNKQGMIRIAGDNEIFEKCVEHKALLRQINKLKDRRTFIDSEIKKYMKDNNAEIIDFFEQGRVTWNKRLYNNIKTDDGEFESESF